MASTRDHWDAVWSSTTATAASWHQAVSEPCATLVRSVTPRHGRVAVIGAGTAPLVGVLAEDGFAVTAIDISATALSLLADQLAHLRGIDYVVGDARSVQLDHRVMTWHDRAVFHFLTEPADQCAYAERAAATVCSTGHLVLATFAPSGPADCSGLPVERHSVDSLRLLFGSTFHIVDSFEADHRTPSGTNQQFTYATFRRSVSPHPNAKKART